MIQPFSIHSSQEFEQVCLETFRFQYDNNQVYREYVDRMKLNSQPSTVSEIPFLPIEFFKSHRVVCGEFETPQLFTSSSTTGKGVSKHWVKDIGLYEKSFSLGFERFYGKVEDYLVLALLPAYLERQGSSLVYMADSFIHASKYDESGFYLNELEALHQRLTWAMNEGIPTLLLGVTFALLDFAEQHPIELQNCIVMETGGMKGRRQELTREEVHQELKTAFHTESIHSEYGMTELLSQAYSKGDSWFDCPPWMQVLVRDPSDPLALLPQGQSGGINVIDLANCHSCSFIATQDLGKCDAQGRFQVLGRFDNSDVRGCNLLVV